MTTGRPAEGAGWGHEGDGYGGPEPYGSEPYRPDAYGPGPTGPDSYGPERYGPDSTGHDPYGHGPSGVYEGQDAYLAAVGALDDPLNDPLPGGHHRQGQAGPPPADAYAHPSGAHGPWLPGANGGPPGGGPDHDPATVGLRRPDGLGSRTGPPPPGDDHGTFPPPAASDTDAPAAVPGGRAARRRAAAAGGAASTATDAAASDTDAPAAVPGGRAARRRAAAAGGAGTGPSGPAGSGPAGAEPAAGGGRAARRKAAKAAAKAAKQTGTAISNVIGELFITTGALLLLFVAYQLWWTNVEARAHASGEADRLTEQWEGNGGADEGEDREPGVFSPGEGFAILSIPDLDVRVPIAETVNPENVLDKGMVGHYSAEDRLPTAMPWDSEGNFGIAGHRNTHAEPFRYINRLEPGDPIVVETEDTYYTYAMASRLDSTEPSNTAVLDPIPEQGGFTEPGRYITLTTCTPEFTSTYRLIVWGELVEERPRSEGKPDALVN